jgi:DNA modification methylase
MVEVYADGIPVYCRFDEILDLVKIIPNPRNPNKHSDAQIKLGARIIKGNGWRAPITISKRSGFVTKGHGRLLFAEAIPVTCAPVEYQEYANEAEEWADILADNRLAELADPDLDLVKDIITSTDNLDIDLTGYTLEDLNADILDDSEGPEAQTDKAEELQHKWNTQYGQVWEIPSKASPGKSHRVMCGDSTVEGDVSKLLNGHVPFIMVTDPPYGVEYDPSWRRNLDPRWKYREGKVQNDNRVDWTVAYTYFPGRVAYVWHAGRFAADIALNLRAAGFEIRTQIIWKKQAIVFGRGHYHWQHEPCWYAVRSGESSKWKGDRKQSTIWEIENVHRTQGSDNEDQITEHGTQKPLECMARPIRNHGEKDDDVYDPFLGSGTTVIAAERCGRICFGMEIDPKYCAVILQRCLDAGLEPKLV